MRAVVDELKERLTSAEFTSSMACNEYPEEINMGLAQYAIVAVGDGQWGVLHDGEVGSEYSTKEAAFESAAVAASIAIREGHEVHLSVPGEDPRGAM